MEFMTMSFTLHQMLGSCSGADGHKAATMYGTPSNTIRVIEEGREENTHILICAGGGGDLCHNLNSENTKEKLLF